MVASGTSITAAIVRQSFGRIPIRTRRVPSFKPASSNLQPSANSPTGGGAAAQSARVKLCNFHTTGKLPEVPESVRVSGLVRAGEAHSVPRVVRDVTQPGGYRFEPSPGARRGMNLPPGSP